MNRLQPRPETVAVTCETFSLVAIRRAKGSAMARVTIEIPIELCKRAQAAARSVESTVKALALDGLEMRVSQIERNQGRFEHALQDQKKGAA